VAVLGLILLAAAGVLTAAVVTSNTDSLAVSLWSVSVSNVTLGVVFVDGSTAAPRRRGFLPRREERTTTTETMSRDV
jgi:hypothetical protein